MRYRVLLAMRPRRLPEVLLVEADDRATAAFFAWIKAGGADRPIVDVLGDCKFTINGTMATVVEASSNLPTKEF